MPTDDSLEYKGDPNVERLAKQDSREQYDDPVDINDQWDDVEVGDVVDIDPAEGGGLGKVSDIKDDEVTVQRKDGSEVTIDINSVIKLDPHEGDRGEEHAARHGGELDDSENPDDDDVSYEATSSFDEMINQQFKGLIDND